MAFTLLLSACAPVGALPKPPPSQRSPDRDWQYAVYLLSVGQDPSQAQRYLERARAEGGVQSPTDAALFDRDLAEARLFAGDLPGAAAAARSGLAELAQRPTSAQLQLADRSLFERDLSAIQAAANLDSDELTQIAQFGSDPPDADPWYLLGWFYERAGDTVQARTAYQAYLELAPAWSFLRRAAQMQHHAKDFVS
jgi:hypothetical protein